MARRAVPTDELGETGALSMRSASSYRQAFGTYSPRTKGFTGTDLGTTSRYYDVQVLAERYLQVADLTADGSRRQSDMVLRDEIQELPKVGAFPFHYSSVVLCQPNELFGPAQRLEYCWTASCLIIWSAPMPVQLGFPTLDIPRPAIQLDFEE
ncbi:hypothetical protein GCM10022409_19240 [Hymenobacter glaciei]|uniref:RES domain-containing protein n=1 Tax=Hymenobacter glaciei TaxID=877209 RepID=A0ABP7U4N9_9BACT